MMSSPSALKLGGGKSAEGLAFSTQQGFVDLDRNGEGGPGESTHRNPADVLKSGKVVLDVFHTPQLHQWETTHQAPLPPAQPKLVQNRGSDAHSRPIRVARHSVLR